MIAGRTSLLASKAASRLQAFSSHLANGHAAPSVGRLEANETALFVCDVQERFRPIISGFSAVVDTAQRMVKGANALEIPVIVTEQYPKALGNTVQEVKDVLNQDSTFIQDKLDFTMYALDLIEEGYEVHLVVDGVSSKRPTDRSTAIQHPAFKAISALAKEDRPEFLPITSNL